MSLWSKLEMIIKGIRYIFANVSIVQKGQAYSFGILQTAHRLEKGLCIRTPRDLWGYDTATKLTKLISLERHKAHSDKRAVEIGIAVLSAYVSAKEKTSESEKLSELKKCIRETGIDLKNSNQGGYLSISKNDILINSENVERLFYTRHSIRDYDETPVEQEKLEKAIELALRAPSACNRQATQIYVISEKDRALAGAGNEYNADKYLIITGEMNAFNLSELNDWIVSTSIFCGYLSLALHSQGIGSCIFRKEIIANSSYNDVIKKICGIPDNEQIILEMAIGNYKEEFRVPVSCRRGVKDVIHYLR